MVKAFTNAANFSGMTLINTKLKLSDIVHKAFIEVQWRIQDFPEGGA